MRNWFKIHNIFNMIMALFIAVVLWFYVVYVVNPVSKKTLSGLPYNFSSENEILEERDLIITSGDARINAYISGGKRDLFGIDVSNVSVSVTTDLSKIKKPGDYELSYSVILPVRSPNVTKLTPYRLPVTISKIITKEIPVKFDMSNIKLKKGYIFEGEPIYPATIEVRGAESELARISYAMITFGEKDVKTSINQQVKYEFKDVDKQTIVPKLLNVESETVLLKVIVKEEVATVVNPSGGGQ